MNATAVKWHMRLLVVTAVALPGLVSAQSVQPEVSPVPAGQVSSAAVAQPQVTAVEPTVMRPSAVRNVGSATRNLLAAQAQGMHASPLQYSMPIDVAAKVYERYLNSFTHEIPEHLGSALNEVRTQN